jgi:hypothetical protein
MAQSLCNSGNMQGAALKTNSCATVFEGLLPKPQIHIIIYVNAQAKNMTVFYNVKPRAF